MHRTDPHGPLGRVNERAALIAAAAAISMTACVLDNHGTGPEQGAGGSGGADTTTTGGGGAPAARGYRRRIAVHAGAATAVPAGYSVSIELDHAALVQEGKSLPGGGDVRIVHIAGGGAQEIDRVLDPGSAWDRGSTVLWFKTQADIDAGQSDDSYFVYHGGQAEGAPPADGSQVFVLWDDFDQEALDPRWTYASIGPTASGSASVGGGAARITARSGDIGAQHDDFAFLHAEISGDFVAEALVTGFGGDLDTSAKLGGVMVRQSVDPGSRYHLMCRRNDGTRISAFRDADGAGALTSELSAGGAFVREYSRVSRLGSTTWAGWSEDAETWSSAGQVAQFSTELSDPLLVGIPLATREQSGDGFVEVEWFRVRRLVDPEPSVELSGEEVAP